MQEAQLLEHVAPEHRDEVKRLYATFIGMGGGDKGIEGFANLLHLKGLISTDGLKDFMLHHALSVGGLPDAADAVERYEIMSLLGHGALGPWR
jgi:hypothetical protein